MSFRTTGQLDGLSQPPARANMQNRMSRVEEMSPAPRSFLLNYTPRHHEMEGKWHHLFGVMLLPGSGYERSSTCWIGLLDRPCHRVHPATLRVSGWLPVFSTSQMCPGDGHGRGTGCGRRSISVRPSFAERADFHRHIGKRSKQEMGFHRRNLQSGKHMDPTSKVTSHFFEVCSQQGRLVESGPPGQTRHATGTEGRSDPPTPLRRPSIHRAPMLWVDAIHRRRRVAVCSR